MDVIKQIKPDPSAPFMGPPMMDVSGIKRKFLDVSYSTQSPNQKLDIYLPDEGEGPFPTIVYAHGGAFIGGNKRDMQLIYVIDGIRRGYAVVSVEYRMVPEIKFPDIVFDFKAALRFLRANAAKYFLDGDRFYSGGDSAGAYLAVFSAATQDNPAFEGAHLGYSKYSSSVKAVIGLFGCYDLHMQAQFSEAHPMASTGKPVRFVDRLMGAETLNTPELLYFTNPSNFVTPAFPPALIQAGDADQVVPYKNSIYLAEKINAVCGSGRATLELFPGCLHGDPKFETPENIDRIFRFLEENK